MTENGSLRASDNDREAVAEVLRQAHAEGRLDYEELDERLTRAFSARTLRDLEQLTRDLPRPDPKRAVERWRETSGQPARAPAAGGPARRDAHPALRATWYAYTVAVGINVLIWAVVSLSSQELIYFWPIWVAGPWGVVLLARSLFVQKRPR